MATTHVIPSREDGRGISHSDIRALAGKRVIAMLRGDPSARYASLGLTDRACAVGRAATTVRVMSGAILRH